MTVNDIGPKPSAFDIENETKDNANYRAVAWSGENLQVTLMSIPAGKSIGLEMHAETDQFLRLDAGEGKVFMGESADELDFEQDVEDGWAIMVPAGTWHDVVNTGQEDLRLYAIYSPTHHAAGIIQATAEDAEKDEESGKDEAPEWARPPKGDKPDGHATEQQQQELIKRALGK